MDSEGKEGSFRGVFIAVLISILIASFYNSVPLIKNSVEAVLNPTAGALLIWNLTLGMTVIILILSLFTTIVQKYTTDQETMRQMRKDQKEMQEQLKKLEVGSKEHTELSMKSMKIMGPMFKLSLRPIIYTAIPLILLFRWFADYFTIVHFSFLGFLNWFWFYFIGTIVFTSILRKMMNVV
ncbi:MAG: EMC3/TMCO1 family protein [Candidatus Pacearchaeota archaeon]|jgi:uncharacterized membrane protein (DUF106 family)